MSNLFYYEKHVKLCTTRSKSLRTGSSSHRFRSASGIWRCPLSFIERSRRVGRRGCGTSDRSASARNFGVIAAISPLDAFQSCSGSTVPHIRKQTLSLWVNIYFALNSCVQLPPQAICLSPESPRTGRLLGSPFPRTSTHGNCPTTRFATPRPHARTGHRRGFGDARSGPDPSGSKLWKGIHPKSPSVWLGQQPTELFLLCPCSWPRTNNNHIYIYIYIYIWHNLFQTHQNIHLNKLCSIQLCVCQTSSRLMGKKCATLWCHIIALL